MNFNEILLKEIKFDINQLEKKHPEIKEYVIGLYSKEFGIIKYSKNVFNS